MSTTPKKTPKEAQKKGRGGRRKAEAEADGGGAGADAAPASAPVPAPAEKAPEAPPVAVTAAVAAPVEAAAADAGAGAAGAAAAGAPKAARRPSRLGLRIPDPRTRTYIQQFIAPKTARERRKELEAVEGRTEAQEQELAALRNEIVRIGGAVATATAAAAEHLVVALLEAATRRRLAAEGPKKVRIEDVFGSREGLAPDVVALLRFLPQGTNYSPEREEALAAATTALHRAKAALSAEADPAPLPDDGASESFRDTIDGGDGGDGAGGPPLSAERALAEAAAAWAAAQAATQMHVDDPPAMESTRYTSYVSAIVGELKKSDAAFRDVRFQDRILQVLSSLVVSTIRLLTVTTKRAVTTMNVSSTLTARALTNTLATLLYPVEPSGSALMRHVEAMLDRHAARERERAALKRPAPRETRPSKEKLREQYLRLQEKAKALKAQIDQSA